MPSEKPWTSAIVLLTEDASCEAADIIDANGRRVGTIYDPIDADEIVERANAGQS